MSDSGNAPDNTKDAYILSSVLTVDGIGRKVLPYLKREYFSAEHYARVFDVAASYVERYGDFPSKGVLLYEIREAKGMSQSTFNDAVALVESIGERKTLGEDESKWLLNACEEFCKSRALYNALIKAAEIVEDVKSADLGKMEIPEGIPDMLATALAVSFDNSIGHDYIMNHNERFEFYHSDVERLPFDIDLLNVITKGGLPRKTLTCIIAPTGVGKSLIMCHQAAFNMTCGKNVLYVTMEMSEERIAERVDANLLNVTIDDLQKLTREEYDSRIERLKSKVKGKLIIKEYPTGSASVANFKALLGELKLKKGFVPDVIYVDYINICASSRVKLSSNVNSYTLIKHIAEELRGMAVEFDVPVITATQTNRSGMSATDLDMSDTSESIGLPFTLDLMYAVVSTEELSKTGKYMFKQLKNRLGDLNFKERFVVGVDKSKMRLFNIEDSEQDALVSHIRTQSAMPPPNMPPLKPRDPKGGLADRLKRVSSNR